MVPEGDTHPRDSAKIMLQAPGPTRPCLMVAVAQRFNEFAKLDSKGERLTVSIGLFLGICLFDYR